MKKLLLFSFALMCVVVSCDRAPEKPMNTTPDGKLVRSEDPSADFDPAGLAAFEAGFAADSLDVHSIMVLHHGKVVAEKWYSEGAPDVPHVMNSVSKSYTATAVGFAISEGLVSLDDKVVSFFPDKVPAEHSPLLDEMTVRHLLTMSTGQAKEPRRTDDWVAGFLAVPVENAPGSVFRYNSMATFMLSAIIQKVSGQKLTEYLQTRLFGPLAIEGYRWDKSPEGINTGGWGLFVKTEDMAKLGQLFLQNGVWNGEQLLPEGWAQEASTLKISSAPSWDYSETDPNSDWTQGYCYQMWRCRHNAFRADGAGGQFIVVIPDKDAVVAITAGLQDMQAELNLVWDHILPALK
jgi:CubicO group peptidase (beta-lactamase class C family)